MVYLLMYSLQQSIENLDMRSLHVLSLYLLCTKLLEMPLDKFVVVAINSTPLGTLHKRKILY